jgi:hypothetical protein
VYPDDALRQLEALLRFRQQTKTEDLLRVGLWLEGYPIVPETLSAALRRIITSGVAALEAELSQMEATGRTRAEAIEDVGRKAARLRGRRRFLSQSRGGRLAERERAFVAVMRLGLGDESIVRELDELGPVVERVLGLDRARKFRAGGVGPWLSGPAGEGLAGVVEFASLPRLLEVMESVTVEELQTARARVWTLLQGISFVCRLADAFSGRRNVTGMGAMAEAAGDLTTRALLTAFVVKAQRSPELASGLEKVCTALDQFLTIGERFRWMASLSAEEQIVQLPGRAGLDWGQQRRLERTLDAFRDQDPPASRRE